MRTETKTYREQIFDALRTEEARERWNGMSISYQGEFVDVLLTKGLDAAVDAMEESTPPETT